MKIIIVDDEGVTRQWVKRKIEEIEGNYQIEGTFPNGQKALEYYRKNQVDVIFTDIRMAPVDGLELLEEVGRTGGEPYEVILSAYDEFQYARQAMQMGVHEFVLKPEITRESIGEILKKAEQYLEAKKSRPSIARDQKSWKHYLSRHLEHGGKADEDLGAELKACGISLEERGLALAVITPVQRTNEEEIIEMLEIYLQEELGSGSSFLIGQQDFMILYNSNIRKDRRTAGREMAEFLKKNLGLDSYIGFAGFSDSYDRIPDMYRQAVTARDNRVFCGIHNTQIYEDMTIQSGENTEELYYGREVKGIIDSVQKGEWQRAAEKTEELFEVIRKNTSIYPAYVKALCGEILAAYVSRTRAFSFKPEYEEGIRTVEKLFADRIWSLEELKNHTIESQKILVRILEEGGRDRRYSSPVQQIMQHVRLNYSQKITMEEIASLVHLNRSYVSALFHRETGVRFSDFLQQVRLEASGSLLRDTKMPIQKIAEETGFVDAAYFSRVFKEKYRITPAEYRKAKQQ